MSYKMIATSSDRKTADAVISDRNALVHAIILEGDGTNAASLIIYDNATTNSGVVLAKVLLKAGDVYASFVPDFAIEGRAGLYADVAGTGAAYIVHYSKL